MFASELNELKSLKMLNQFSWSVYFQFVAAILITYYCIILFIFYKANIKNWLALKFHVTSIYETRSGISGTTGLTDETKEINFLLNAAKELIQKAASNKSPKEEILFALQRLLASEKFQGIDRTILNDFISKECESIGSIHLSEEDLNTLWVR